MKLIRSSNMGFCFGVRNAVKRAVDYLAEGKELYCLGQLINNEHVVKRLEERGLKTVEDISLLPDGCTVMIRSHGVGKEIYEKLRARNIEIIDATCPFVGNIQTLADKYNSDGYKICIIGDKTHPEVKGINGWCNNNAEFIVDENDLQKLEKFKRPFLT